MQKYSKSLTATLALLGSLSISGPAYSKDVLEERTKSLQQPIEYRYLEGKVSREIINLFSVDDDAEEFMGGNRYTRGQYQFIIVDKASSKIVFDLIPTFPRPIPGLPGYYTYHPDPKVIKDIEEGYVVKIRVPNGEKLKSYPITPKDIISIKVTP